MADNIQNLTLQKLISIHLSTSYSSEPGGDKRLRSTLSFIHENIQHAWYNNYSKQLMPCLSLCAILDQLGICYQRTDKPKPKFQDNALQSCLYYFGEIDENDAIIKTLYAFRNGLLHNISLNSRAKHATQNNYVFDFDSTIGNVYKAASEEWNGSYDDLMTNRQKYTTYLNREKFKDLVYSCIQKAEELNGKSLLKLRLKGGKQQLYFDYIRTVPI